VSEINKAMSQLDTVVQQNAATSEEAASAAEELSVQADSLKTSVDELMHVITGASNHDVAAKVAPTKTTHPQSNLKKQSSVIHMKSTRPAKARVNESYMKKAAGDGISVPSWDDNGFKGV
jgi:methyl-accepting chemotaxis protein